MIKMLDTNETWTVNTQGVEDALKAFGECNYLNSVATYYQHH